MLAIIHGMMNPYTKSIEFCMATPGKGIVLHMVKRDHHKSFGDCTIYTVDFGLGSSSSPAKRFHYMGHPEKHVIKPFHLYIYMVTMPSSI